MRINADLVKNRTSIEACLLKHSQEFRVLATLRYLFLGKYDAMVNEKLLICKIVRTA